MKKILSILCVLLTVFLCSCKTICETGETTTTSTNTTTTQQTPESTTEPQQEISTTKKYMLTENQRDSLTPDQYDVYKIIIDSIDKGLTEIPIKIDGGTDEFSRIKSALWSSYPLMALVDGTRYSDGVLHIIYTKNGDELQNAIKDFYDRVNSILTTDILSSNSFGKALMLYSHIAKCDVSDNPRLTMYDVIMNSVGTSVQISMAYEYFLGLAGVESIHLSADTWDREMLNFTAVKLNSNYYIMSPYHEALDNNGKKLTYFGLTTERLEYLTNASDLFSIDTDTVRHDAPVCTDDTYEFTQVLETWAFDFDTQTFTYEITDELFTYKYN